MAFNKINLLSVEDRSVSQVNIQYLQDVNTSQSITNAKDIFYHLGTDLLRSGWSNPTGGSYLTVTTNTVESPTFLIDRSDSEFRPNMNPPITITWQFLTGFQVDMQAFRYMFGINDDLALNKFTWEGSNDGTNWTTLYTANNLHEQNSLEEVWYYEPILDNRQDYYSYLRLNIIELALATASFAFLKEIEIYGKLRNQITGVAGFKTPGDRFDNLLDVDAYNPRSNREIIYDKAQGVWESRINQPWTVINNVMDNDLTLTRDDLRNPRFYILSPNGQSRNVYLPPAVVNDAIKFRNLDGLFDINIFEDGGSTPVVLNNAGKLQYEYVFDGQEWNVVG